MLTEEGEVVREGARRVNADSSTKAATAAEGREEHGKRAKVKGNSGGFKFKATVSVCILTAAPHPQERLYFHSQQQPHPASLFTPTTTLNPKPHTNRPLCHTHQGIKVEATRRVEVPPGGSHGSA